MNCTKNAGSLGIALALVACNSLIGLTEPTVRNDAAAAVALRGYASGTRLRARVLDGGGGDGVLFLGFQDSALGVPCSFAVADDGVVRCLPDESDAIYFVDAACKQAVIVRSCDQPPTYARWSSPSAASSFCWTGSAIDSPRTEVLAADAALPTLPAPLYQQDPTGCNVTTYAPTSGTAYRVHVVGATAFVAATESKDPRGEHMAARVALAEDGARQVVGYFDAKQQKNCGVVSEAIGYRDDTCIPLPYGWANVYADASCTQLAAQAYTGCSQPAVAVDAQTDATPCTPAVHLYGVGDPIPSVFSKAPSACSAVAPSDYRGMAFFHTTGAIDITTYPTVRIAPFGTSSLRPYYRTTPDGVRILPVQRFRDATNATDCFPTYLGDGSLRCVPEPASYLPSPSATGHVYADAACTQEIAAVSVYATCGGLPLPIAVVVAPPSTCAPAAGYVEVRSLVTPSRPSTIYSKDAQQRCQPGVTSDLYYAVGPPIPPDRFPLLTRRTE